MHQPATAGGGEGVRGGRLAWTAGVATALAHLPFVFQGLDVTDPGLHLVAQAHPFRDNGGVANLLPLTNAVGALWLAFGPHHLLWVRLGAVLLYGATAFAAQHLLARHFPPRRVLACVLVCGFFVTSRDMLLVHYFNLPALLLVLVLATFDGWLATAPGRPGFGARAAGLGALAVACVAARFSLLPVFLLPLLGAGAVLRTGGGRARLRRAAPWLVGGVGLSLALFAALLAGSGLAEPYREATLSQALASLRGGSGGVSTRHGLGFVLRETGLSLLQAALVWAVALPGLLGLGALRLRVGRRAAAALLAAGALALAVAVALRGVVFYYPLLAAYLALGAVTGVAAACWMRETDPARRARLGPLVLLAVAVAWITPLGSNTGLRKATYGMWVALPLALLLAGELVRRTRGPLRALLSLHDAVLPALLVAGLFVHLLNPERDHANRFRLDTPFRSAPLRGVYSEAERVRVVDELLAQMAARGGDGPVLLLGHVPLVYFLAAREPLFPDPWIALVSPEKADRLAREATAAGRLPGLVVTAKVDTRSPTWPDARTTGLTEAERPTLALLRRHYLDELGYARVWENEAFAVYAPPRGARGIRPPGGAVAAGSGPIGSPGALPAAAGASRAGRRAG